MVLRIITTILITTSVIYAQFGRVDVTFDTRLLRSDEKLSITNLKTDIQRFYTSSAWDDAYSDLEIPLHIQLIFEGIMQKGNEKVFSCQALFSNGGDLRYFDKSVQFIYNAGTSLYFDPVLFEPLVGFLAFYGQLILAGEIDTYEFKGGNAAYELARDISLRGSASEYRKGWSARTALVDDLNRNLGLRKARLAWYISMDLFSDGDVDGFVEEIQTMMDGLEESYRDLGRNSQTQFFLKVQSEKISSKLQMLGRIDLLNDMIDLDPDRKDLYQSAISQRDE